ncbi:uncharacterized protein STEHIDRAFT_156704 [Stereum hirsutum FP-91666 SS1]|uniref:uncharacterized protein n=1 Tax=Stereum hirsutum (strain FP-91666) TaxID=721885 RepID=UPI000440BCF6|nr:uncharacterized protein STEHIDRAFT_156704 [Stereum hirsutum FP-91666 SS1]EIM86380.1 hypothetical protein STEHIDRAFT_156704 [Stereum hirsutum FP-91666 SS1]
MTPGNAISYTPYLPAVPIPQHPYLIPYPLPYPQDHPGTPYPVTLGHPATQNHPPAAPVASPVLAFIILGPEEPL